MFAASGAAQAQVATAIVPATDAQGLATTVVSRQGAVAEIDGGDAVGANLFHTFESFDLAAGDTARWVRSSGDASAFHHVINRVNGGSASNIYGRLDAAAFTNAEFYFINPAGVVFGPTATVAVPNGFHVATADRLVFADQFVLATNGPAGSVLTSAPPEAFGFVGPAAGAIDVIGTRMTSLSNGSSLSLIGGQVTLTDGARIDVPSGQIVVAAVEQADRFVIGVPEQNIDGMSLGDLRIDGGVRLFADAYDLNGADAFLTLLGNDIELAGDAQVTSDNVSANTGGRVVLQASGDVGIREGAVLRTAALETGDALGIDVQVGGRLTIDGSGSLSSGDVTALSSLSQPRAMVAQGGNAGALNIRAGSIELVNGGQIQSISTARGGDAGTITIETGDLRIVGENDVGHKSIISASLEPGAAGSGGDVSLSVEDLTVLDGGQVSAFTKSVGDGGNIIIGASGDVFLEGSDASIISTSDLGATGDGGRIEISATHLTILNDAEVSAASLSSGGAGEIRIVLSGDLRIVGQSASESTGIFTQTGSDARRNLGSIEVDADNIYVASHGGVSSRTNAVQLGLPGAMGATIDLRAASTIALSDESYVVTETKGARDAGTIRLVGDTVSVENSRVSSQTSGSGAGGSVVIEGQVVGVFGGASLETASSTSSVAGNIQIASDQIRIDGEDAIVSSRNTSSTGGAAGAIAVSGRQLEVLSGGALNTDSATGAAGEIQIDLISDGLLILGGDRKLSTITTSSGPGQGGRITISNPAVLLSDGGQILALGEAGGANVAIEAEYFIRSADQVNNVLVDGDTLIDADLSDQSRGAAITEVELADPSVVLNGRCASVRASGEVSRLAMLRIGPYANADEATGCAAAQASTAGGNRR